MDETNQAPDGERETLRDKFAMAALAGMLADSDAEALTENELAVRAYNFADAMLAARKARIGGTR